MSVSNLQLDQLSTGPTFQAKVRASIFKKALAIIEDVLAHGVTPTVGANYSAPQNTRALSICRGQSLTGYYEALACSTNVIASTLFVSNGETQSDISDPALDSQVYTVIFLDLV